MSISRKNKNGRKKSIYIPNDTVIAIDKHRKKIDRSFSYVIVQMTKGMKLEEIS